LAAGTDPVSGASPFENVDPDAAPLAVLEVDTA
jgi:hypothetical protein